MKFLAFIVAVAVVGLTLTAAATAGSWRQGTPYMVSEEDAQDFLEKAFDWAYCSGIPRFGTQGEFPYEEFVVFDCDFKHNGSYCSDWRQKAVKGSKRGYFRLKVIKMGDCF